MGTNVDKLAQWMLWERYAEGIVGGVIVLLMLGMGAVLLWQWFDHAPFKGSGGDEP
jgi:hypothetical protein